MYLDPKHPSLNQFRDESPEHNNLQCTNEHEQHWITCLDCGGQWSVNRTPDDFNFEQVSIGDGSCEEEFAQEVQKQEDRDWNIRETGRP